MPATDPAELEANARSIGNTLKAQCPDDVAFLFLIFHKGNDGAVAFSTNARRGLLAHILDDFSDRLKRISLDDHIVS
jgi:hypothetical protein